ncbi:GDSL-type esterase/lipase family protein [Parabacteroides sp. OttesenSCG-928-G07]|nr:GDSL-type esterase/lipase family protein [Parabacteroides sp. OttesenSCG-928-G21]MDL2278567.1 GDSL-type esterase/lipase family protein [Parabacteroides sp. OttesenSCG-928-G07]
MIKQKKAYTNVLLMSFLCLWTVFSPFTISGEEVLSKRDSVPLQVVDSLSLSIEPKPVNMDTLLGTLKIPIVDSLCIISDPTHSLAAFWEELNKLRSRKDTVINIVHLGDSHIQVGYYSGRVMRLMHEAFGNAGRGWIAPYKLSKVNEPDDYFFSSAVKEWTAGRVIQRTKRTSIGPGGIGVKSLSPSINFDIIIAPRNGAGYGFNQVVLYRNEKAMPMLPTGALKDSIDSVLGNEPLVKGLSTDTFYISCLTDTLQLFSTRRKQGTDSVLPASLFENVYYGANLMNGGSGVLYHSVGVNGSMFVNFTDENFVQQLALLKPSLLIISLGTNETFGARFRKQEFKGQINDFLTLVKRHLPQTAIMLTTPPECYKRTRVDGKRVYVRNANTEFAADAITEIAAQQGLACWDLFAATGGKGSNSKWYSNKLMGADRIHFNKDGYKDQGTLLFYALMNLYNKKFKEEISSDEDTPDELTIEYVEFDNP